MEGFEKRFLNHVFCVGLIADYAVGKRIQLVDVPVIQFLESVFAAFLGQFDKVSVLLWLDRVLHSAVHYRAN